MSLQTTIWLGLAMAAIAVINAGLMAWLWRFPMAPDPSGRDPHGVSTAPRSWTMVHRVLGYFFVLLYLILLWEMVARAWEFRVASAVSIAHGVLGVLIGVLLGVKITIIRRARRFGHLLPLIGGTLTGTTLIMVALVVPPAWQVGQPLATLTPEMARGRHVVATRCVQCHGAATIASEREDTRKWDRITREMQRYSRRFPGKTPISHEERVLAANYLARTLAENADDRDAEDTEERNDDGRRRRRRGRD